MACSSPGVIKHRVHGLFLGPFCTNRGLTAGPLSPDSVIRRAGQAKRGVAVPHGDPNRQFGNLSIKVSKPSMADQAT